MQGYRLSYLMPFLLLTLLTAGCCSAGNQPLKPSQDLQEITERTTHNWLNARLLPEEAETIQTDRSWEEAETISELQEYFQDNFGDPAIIAEEGQDPFWDITTIFEAIKDSKHYNELTSDEQLVDWVIESIRNFKFEDI